MPRQILTLALVWFLSGEGRNFSLGQGGTYPTVPCPPSLGTPQPAPRIPQTFPNPVPGTMTTPGTTTPLPYRIPGTSPTPTIQELAPEQTAPATMNPTTTPAVEDDFFSQLGNRTSGFFGGNPGAGGGGLASASMVAMNQPITLSRSNISPFVLPGLFSATQTEGLRPVDRVFFDYGYFDRFLFAATGGPSGTTPTQVGYDLNRLNVGIEKTFANGRLSFYGKVPFLIATGNTTGRDFDGLGGINAGLKGVLFHNPRTQSLISTGLTVTFSTAKDFVAVQTRTYTPQPTPDDIRVNPALGVRSSRTTINPTFFQPWIGGVYVRDRWFVQQYLGFVIASEDRLPTLLNSSTGFGYTLLQGRPGSLISRVTPAFDVQFLAPLSNNNVQQPGVAPVNLQGTTYASLSVPAFDTDSQRLRFSDQVVFTGSLAIGIRERTQLSIGLSLPAAGPRSFTYGTTIGFSYFY